MLIYTFSPATCAQFLCVTIMHYYFFMLADWKNLRQKQVLSLNILNERNDWSLCFRWRKEALLVYSKNQPAPTTCLTRSVFVSLATHHAVMWSITWGAWVNRLSNLVLRVCLTTLENTFKLWHQTFVFSCVYSGVKHWKPVRSSHTKGNNVSACFSLLCHWLTTNIWAFHMFQENTGRLAGIFKKSPKPAPRSITTEVSKQMS